MAPNKLMICLVMLLVLLPMATKGDDLTPKLAPYFDDICSEVECGKGNCKAGTNYNLNYICECDAGWKRTRLDGDYEQNLQYLPCIVPECNLDYSCMPALSPFPALQIPDNPSVMFDPCHWMYCGEGTCIKSSTYKFTCQCQYGYHNLFNNTCFPCYSDCAVTSDCERLGIKASSITSSTTEDNNISLASTFLPGKFHLIGIMVISMVMALWK